MQETKSFMLCKVYRPPSTLLNFLEDVNINFMDSLFLGLNAILLWDQNCNPLRSCSDSQALLDFCATTNLVQSVQDPVRITETSKSLIGAALTTNKNIIYSDYQRSQFNFVNPQA